MVNPLLTGESIRERLSDMDGLTDIHFDGSRFKRAREKAGLSQAEAALKLGLKRQHVWAYENGKGKPSADTLARACYLYGVDIADITSEVQAA